MIESFNPPGMRKPFGIFSTAAWAGPGETLYLSGQVAETATQKCVGVGDIKAQARQVLDNLQAALQHAGGSLADIVTMKVYVTDMRFLDAVHEVRAEYFSEPYPASTLVQVVALVNPDFLIEIDAVATVRRG